MCVCVCVDRIVSGVVFNLLQIGLNCSGFRCLRNRVRAVHFEKVSHVSIAKITVIYVSLNAQNKFQFSLIEYI